MIQLKIYLLALWRNWWIVVLTAVVAVAGSLLFNYTAQPVYRTRLQLLIVPNMLEFDGRELIYSLDTLDKRSIVATYVEVAGSGRIRRETLDTLGLSGEEALNYDLTAVALPEANVLEIAASGPDPQTAADLANAAAAQTVNYVSQTYDIFRLEQLDPAPVPQFPISPTPWRDAALAFILGLVLGSVLAILRDQIREPLNVTLRQWQAYDHTSSAYKRPYLERRLEQLLAEEAPRLMVAVVQLNGLARLDLPANITHTLMRRIVNLIREELPGRDIVGRWDEHGFVVIMRHIDQAEEARQKLARLQEELSQPLEVYPGGEMVTLSPRLSAVISREGESLGSLKERLSLALVQADKNGHEPTLYQQDIQARQHEGMEL